MHIQKRHKHLKFTIPQHNGQYQIIKDFNHKSTQLECNNYTASQSYCENYHSFQNNSLDLSKKNNVAHILPSELSTKLNWMQIFQDTDFNICLEHRRKLFDIPQKCENYEFENSVKFYNSTLNTWNHNTLSEKPQFKEHVIIQIYIFLFKHQVMWNGWRHSGTFFQISMAILQKEHNEHHCKLHITAINLIKCFLAVDVASSATDTHVVYLR